MKILGGHYGDASYKLIISRLNTLDAQTHNTEAIRSPSNSSIVSRDLVTRFLDSYGAVISARMHPDGINNWYVLSSNTHLHHITVSFRMDKYNMVYGDVGGR